MIEEMEINLTPMERKVMRLATQEAHRLNHERVEVLDLIGGLLFEEKGIVARAIARVKLDFLKVRIKLEALSAQTPRGLSVGKLPYASDVVLALERAREEARTLCDPEPDSEHFLLGLLHKEERVLLQILESFQVKPIDLETAVFNERTLQILAARAFGSKPPSRRRLGTYRFSPDPVTS